MQRHEWEHVQEALARVRSEAPEARPRVGIVLGTGLGGLVEEIRIETTIPYTEIPYFPRPTVEGHAGRFLLGTLGGVPVAAMEGRYHLYEGYNAAQVAFPIRVIAALGAELLIVSNASGGMNPTYDKGDLVVIDDHINLMGANPLIGPNDDRLGPRYPDMSRPYDPALIKLAMEEALKLGIAVKRGVYVGVVGPNLETRAEYRFLRLIGADVVGMSTIPEVLTAIHAGLRVLGFSIVTDLCLPDALEPVEIADILATANRAEGKLRRLVLAILARLDQPAPRN
ncbi:purine nucleoside phosphorylase I, inosine and guanosine-specific [Isosphaera pallida ATCC 43644]|jgi:purine-nucleoside phosphorylase|uniref:Purine nucleoside phosphorylase n=1 Tax=Isosphaera pallida (strain ATCC 43644 / DSM 9630 / IS1B) TaxID=575540 RepID=E8QX39_ISOPI|nr:purine-nucleoside phosphorylase [Isosphaera pallida]ADV60872.1 purine nucleoside phosphorylase I, inosine and guanosine-specific [Isosphaera pallida ATCC 43644]